MAPTAVFGKLKRQIKQKRRENRPARQHAPRQSPPAASPPSDHPPPALTGASRQLSDVPDARDRPQKLIRLLGSAANRTFLTSSPRSPTPASSFPPAPAPGPTPSPPAPVPAKPDVSPVAVHDARHPTIEALSLDDPHDAAEAVFRPPTIPAVRVAACTTAGWQLSVDTSGSGNPVRTRKANQDSYAVEPMFSGLLAAVYDGHGAYGRDVSQLVRDVVPAVMREVITGHTQPGDFDSLVLEDRRRLYHRAFSKAFVEAEHTLKDSEDIDDSFSGTTGTAVWLDGSDLYVAWTGDSRALMARADGTVDLTWDQKPTRQDEKKRVRQAGARVTRWKKNSGPQRVWLPDEWLPGLAMTRSIGDTVLSKYGVTPNPEVTVTRIGSADEFVVVASDGVWEFMTSDDVVDFVVKGREKGCSVDEIARRLVQEAVKRWTENEAVVDDTTAIIIFVDGSKIERRADGEPRKSVLRRKRVEVPCEARVGVPWLVTSSGRLLPFAARNEDHHTDEE